MKDSELQKTSDGEGKEIYKATPVLTKQKVVPSAVWNQIQS